MNFASRETVGPVANCIFAAILLGFAKMSDEGV